MSIKKSGQGTGQGTGQSSGPASGQGSGQGAARLDARSVEVASTRQPTLAELLGKEIDKAKSKWAAAEGAARGPRKSWDSLGGSLRVAARYYVTDLARHSSAIDVLIRGAIGASPDHAALLGKFAQLECKKAFQSLGFSATDAERLVQEAILFMLGMAAVSPRRTRFKRKPGFKKRKGSKKHMEEEIAGEEEDVDEDDLVEGVNVICEAMKEALHNSGDQVERRLKSVLLALRNTAKQYELLDRGGESFGVRVIAAESMLGSLVGLAEKGR